jgi:hypothetical protein
MIQRALDPFRRLKPACLRFTAHLVVVQTHLPTELSRKVARRSAMERSSMKSGRRLFSDRRPPSIPRGSAHPHRSGRKFKASSVRCSRCDGIIDAAHLAIGSTQPRPIPPIRIRRTFTPHKENPRRCVHMLAPSRSATCSTLTKSDNRNDR